MITVMRKLRTLAVLAVFVALGPSCGGSDSADQVTATGGQSVSGAEAEPVATADPTPQVTVEATPVETIGSAADPEEPASARPELVDEVVDPVTTIPQTDDPCSSAADHVIGGDPALYKFTFEDEDRAVAIRVGGDQALTEQSTVWVLLHGAGMGWDLVLWMVDNFVGNFVGPAETQIVVSANANAGPPEPAFWSQGETFNAEYLATLFDHLGSSLCLDRADVGLLGLGQGALAAAQGLCQADLPVDLVLMYVGLYKIADCAPARAVPILSLDSYEFDPLTGAHWDGSWSTGSPLETELTGGVGPTPDDLAVWAELYNCTDGPAERVLPDEANLLQRDSVVLSYRDCDAPLTAIGMEDALYDLRPQVLAPVDDVVREFLDVAFGP